MILCRMEPCNSVYLILAFRGFLLKDFSLCQTVHLEASVIHGIQTKCKGSIILIDSGKKYAPCVYRWANLRRRDACMVRNSILAMTSVCAGIEVGSK